MTNLSPESLCSELSRAQAQLEHYKVLIRGNRDGLWQRNLETDELWVSERWCTMLGYDYVDRPLSFTKFKEFVHPNDITNLETALDEHLSGRVPEYWCKYRIRDNFDGWREVVARGLLTKDERGQRHLAGSHVDASEIFERVKGLEVRMIKILINLRIDF